MFQFHVDAGNQVMFNFDSFLDSVAHTCLHKHTEKLQQAMAGATKRLDGNLDKWLSALNGLPVIQYDSFSLDTPAVTSILPPGGDDQQKRLKEALLQLNPWRKGPFCIGQVFIDSEWRSDLKWERVSRHITSLTGRHVLDVGCGNGYYMFRMAAQNPKIVIGLDPSFLFLAQFKAICRYLPALPVHLLPLGFEDFPEETEAFDTVFSMGVFYHRRSPFDFLRSLRLMLRKGGELVLETLVIDGDENQVLVPPDRYARMSNVWFLPSVAAMQKWLKKAGFADIRVVDICQTTSEEQRSTEWMPGESFSLCISPDNPQLTVEGLPYPTRATFVCTR
jgi:tRNA (mo5U34)-methyltransferase